MSRILVTGGCGYIGSHTVVDLVEHGYEVVSVDNFSRGRKELLQGINSILGKEIQNEDVDLADRNAVEAMFKRIGQVDGIIHFAAYKWVGESVQQPLMYYRNNVNALINVIEFAGKQYKKPAFVFSSSCSVYGNPQQLPVTEQTPWSHAESPYAYTKQIGERIITDATVAQPDLPAILLRYFNPVGSHPSGVLGDFQDPPENLVPYITQTAIGKRAELKVFGNDYNTRDGSCIRDYIHVCDIAHAHTLAMQYLEQGKATQNPEVLNLGSGNGVTVLEVIEAFERATGKKLNYSIAPRRPGDVEAVYADNTKARTQLGWNPDTQIDDMMLTAWKWEQYLASL